MVQTGSFTVAFNRTGTSNPRFPFSNFWLAPFVIQEQNFAVNGTTSVYYVYCATRRLEKKKKCRGSGDSCTIYPYIIWMTQMLVETIVYVHTHETRWRWISLYVVCYINIRLVYFNISLPRIVYRVCRLVETYFKY